MEIEIKDKRYGCLSLVMWFLLIFFTGMIMIGLGSCKSVKYVPIETIKHDSIYISKTDTLKVTHTIKEKEYVTVKDSSSIVLDEQGKVLKQEIWHNKTIIRQMSDSLEYYKAKFDSLYSAKQDTFYIPYPIERERKATFKELFFYQIGKYSIIPIIALVVLIIICVKKRLFF